MLLELSLARFLNEEYAGAKETLERLKEIKPDYRPSERDLLFARTLEQLGELDAALAEYETLARTYAGAEAKCRYGMLLQRSGQAEKAREVFRQIVVVARRSPKFYRRTQKPWIDIAKQNMRG